MELIFCQAVPDDAERIAALVNSAYRGEHSRHGWTTEADLLDGRRTDADEVRHLISGPASRILMCLQGSELVGSVLIQRAEDAVELGMFVVEPDLQGGGIGKRLLAFAEHTAREVWSARKIVMHVVTSRQELIAFYQRRGYRRTGVIEPFPLNPAVWTPKVSGLQLEVLEKSLIDEAASAG